MVLDPEKRQRWKKDNKIYDRAQCFTFWSDIMHELPNRNVLFVSSPVKSKQLLWFFMESRARNIQQRT